MGCAEVEVNQANKFPKLNRGAPGLAVSRPGSFVVDHSTDVFSITDGVYPEVTCTDSKVL